MEQNPSLQENTRSKPKKGKKKIKIIISVILFFLIVGGGYTWFLVNKASSAVRNAAHDLARGDKSDLRDKAVKPITNNVSVLVMGVDESDVRGKEYGEAIRTDALLLATFNKDSKTVKLLSIPRDTYTYIPVEKKKDKITHAHAYGSTKNGKDGGPQASIDAVEKLLNVPVDYFVKFNFKSFMKIVDDLGGIEVDVPVEFTEQDSNDNADAIHLKKGVQKLNSEEALALARTRHIDSDAMRGQRQQLVIEAILHKLTSVGSVTKVGNIIDDINGQFVTNLTFDDMLSFYKYGSDSEIEKLQIQGDDCYMEKGDDTCSKSAGGGRTYYYNPDKKELAKVTNDLRAHLGLPAYTKTESDSKKTSTEKTKESKSENSSERESSNNEEKNSSADTETSSNDNE
ncbi:LytR family transcriptional regulator [Bacillus sp. AFS094611]|uniref:LytR family transcriptional regulator n=1 Tax=Bacillus thuringiensis serovar sooncheon TaxID=180891 RepID=A0A9Q5SEH0_BACTU|nr:MULTISPECIES: LCP family protein [Bacillus]OTW67438.1 LytR family transcriptional regulator [Bacillus thuringiensis serovar coreanensis]OTX44054.1 LytR family transcriptional regulator [Bacillus thuringiensis serovar sooncheon]OTX53218.1 LytR family transcriptional regulator [Bacillus thuringiensis serovar guiyangiensis]OTX67539.1 LytR family transcriptional regulator [Bacillus thuringiensis serovar roskildiensis]PDZ52348.1 LytR family transcriptional regulator [Bacillus sp. AFS094611]